MFFHIIYQIIVNQNYQNVVFADKFLTVSNLTDRTMESTTLKPSEDWRSLTIYQVMVGSFLHGEDGAEGYDDMWRPAGERKDGNLRGVINALDHIKGLGVNAIWLTPIFDSHQDR